MDLVDGSCIVSQQLRAVLLFLVPEYNQKTSKLQDKLKKDSLEYFNDQVVEDLEKIKPGEFIEAIHLDCLLLCIVKNLKSQKTYTVFIMTIVLNG